MIYKHFEFKNTFFLIAKKTAPMFSDIDNFNAKCVGVEVVSPTEHRIDFRVVCEKAVRSYLKMVFTNYMSHPYNDVERKELVREIKATYAKKLNHFNTKHLSAINKALPITVSEKPLREYQIDTLMNSLHRRFNLLALDMGLGKTITAAMLTVLSNSNRTVIICPSLVKFNWLEDMTKEWGFNAMYWTIIDAVPRKTVRAFQEKFVVINFEQVAKHTDYLLSSDINHIIIDETHFLKNLKTARSKAVLNLIKNSPKARVTMLSGTPIVNRVTDFFAYLKIAGHPLGNNFELFMKKYCLRSQGDKGKVIGTKNEGELRGLVSNFMIRRLTESCLDLPELNINKYFFEFEDIDNHYFEELNRLRDLKEEYDKLHGKEKAQMAHKIKGNINTLNRIVATSKVPKIKELVDQLNDDGEKVIVFSSYNNPINELEKAFGDKCIKITGSVGSQKRMQLINQFKDDPKTMVFLGNMKAAGIGVNLVNARHVIYTNLPFTPDQVEQSQKRAHRSGQKRAVFVYYTIAKGSIDEHIFNLVGGKARDISSLLDSNGKGTINYQSLQEQLFNSLLD